MCNIVVINRGEKEIETPRQIVTVEVLSLASYTTITDNTAHVYIPDMKNYINGDDIFNLKIEVSLPYN